MKTLGIFKSGYFFKSILTDYLAVMRNFIAVLLSVSTALNLFSQAPGNTSSNLVLWLKPSSFTPVKWSDLSSTSNNFTQTTASIRPSIASNLVNYNSVIDFSTSGNNWDNMNGKVILQNGQKDFSVLR